ncbi:aurora kinase A-A-like [Anopheles merus]|uniref:aurora kinase A-A-like n=1 Tax=Anopheles merus TaxID=30066 RepID=UPI001BE413F9|nr:aurora kinase A-A-like [Anopheles merus]
MVHGQSHIKTVDLSNLCVLAYELLCGKVPFLATTYEESYYNIMKLQFKMPPDMTKPAADLIPPLFVKDLASRMPLKHVASIPGLCCTCTKS